MLEGDCYTRLVSTTLLTTNTASTAGTARDGRSELSEWRDVVTHPPYSPDGTKIAAEYVERQSCEAKVVCVYLHADRVEELARFAVSDHSHQRTHIHTTWSRDGREVLLNVDQSGHSELWAVEV